MSFSTVRCPNCGNIEKITRRLVDGEAVFSCPNCDSDFFERLAKREYEKLHSALKSDLDTMIDEALIERKMETYYNLRSMLCQEVSADHISSKSILEICRDILAIVPGDFLADFLTVANGSDTVAVAKFIDEIDVKENEASLGIVLDFITKSLDEDYIIPTSALLDRCGKVFTPEKRQEYLTKFEKEAANVQDGIYALKRNRDVFLAYSGKDMPKVVELLKFIESEGFSCFAAFRNLQHGKGAVENYEKALQEAINHCSIFLFVSSSNSRKYSCDAFDKELAYIRDTEMDRYSAEYRSYEQIPEEYKKLRIEYRLDNLPTRAAERDIKEFFSGLTYVEDHDQLIDRLVECKRKLRKTYAPKKQLMDYDTDLLIKAVADETERRRVEASERKELITKLKYVIEAKLTRDVAAQRKAEVEAKRKAEEIKLKAEAEAKRKAEEEAKRKAEAEAKQKAEAEEKRKVVETLRKLEEAQRLAEEEAKRKAEDERKRKEEEAKRKAAEIKAQDDAKRKAESAALLKEREESERRSRAKLKQIEELEKKRKKQKIWGIVALFLSWPVGVVLLLCAYSTKCKIEELKGIKNK